MKKLYAILLFLILLSCAGVHSTSIVSKTIETQDNIFSSLTEKTQISYKTLSELPSPLIAGPMPKSYYDDGVLYYVHTADTIGYNIDHQNIGLEFNLKFTDFGASSWFSLTLKANGCDRTQSPNLTQKGYSILIFNHGLIQLLKDGAVVISHNINSIELHRKYNIKISSISQDDKAIVSISINNTQVLNYEDLSSPYITGDWFNICSDGVVSAELYSTKTEYVPNYDTYTLSTIGNDILTSNNANVDINKNISLMGSAGAVGIFNYNKNFSFEFNANFSAFASYNNFWISWRSSSFDRASTTSNTRGYSARICQSGTVEIYKNETIVMSSYFEPFVENTNYIIEIGAIDYSNEKTKVFININNKKISSYIDQVNPIQSYGFICINNDGNVSCNLTSVNSKLVPLSSTYKIEYEKTIIDVYFYNTISYKQLNYIDFSERQLKSILINDISIYDTNSLYHTSTSSRAVDLTFSDNKLSITVYSSVISTTNQNETLTVNSIELKKSTQTSGFITNNGFVLAQNYIFQF